MKINLGAQGKENREGIVPMCWLRCDAEVKIIYIVISMRHRVVLRKSCLLLVDVDKFFICYRFVKELEIIIPVTNFFL